MKSNYVAGICNIGNTQIRIRYIKGFFSLCMTAIFLLVFFKLHLDKIFELAIFFPLTAASIYFIQAQFHFCSTLGVKGRYSFSNDAVSEYVVEDEEDHLKDVIKSLKIILASIVIGIIVTALFYYII